MEINFINYIYKNKNNTFNIYESEINGITGNNYKELIDIIKLKKDYKGKIIIDKKEITNKNIYEYKNKILFIGKELDIKPYKNTIYELLYEEIKNKKIKLKDPNKKINDAVKIVGLSKEIVTRNTYTLSSSEKKLIQIAIALISNPSMLILEDPFIFLDTINTKKILLLLNRIKDQYKKTIVLATTDSEILYKYTKHTIIINKNEIIEGKTQDIFTNLELLNNNDLQIPEIVQFTYLAKNNKKVKIDYHIDIRDIIKDIYKHV